MTPMHAQGPTAREGYLLVESQRLTVALPAAGIRSVVPLHSEAVAAAGRSGPSVTGPDGAAWPVFELDAHLRPVPPDALKALAREVVLLNVDGHSLGLMAQRTVPVGSPDIRECVSIPGCVRETASPVRTLLRLADGALVVAVDVAALAHHVLDATDDPRERAHG